MMTDKQQIEDMAMELYNNQDKIDVTNPYEVAELLYNAGYRKVDENAVVMRGGELAGKLGIEWSKGYAQARKETAKEILQLLKKRHTKVTYNVRGIDTLTIYHNIGIDIDELAKQYGVEVEDNGN